MRRVAGRIGFRKLFRMRLASESELGDKIITEYRQHLRLQPISCQLFDVDVMVRLLEMSERYFLGVAPAIGFPSQEGNAFGVGRVTNEGREIGRQRRQRQLVDQTVAFIIPGQRDLSSKLNEHKQAKCANRYSFHWWHLFSGQFRLAEAKGKKQITPAKLGLRLCRPAG